MGLLDRTLARLVTDDGESRLRHLDRAGRRYTYLQIAGEVGRLGPRGRLVIGFHGPGAHERQMAPLVPLAPFNLRPDHRSVTQREPVWLPRLGCGQ